jgi:hypothetical protein
VSDSLLADGRDGSPEVDIVVDPHFQVRRLSSYDRALRGEFRYCGETEPD